MNSADAIVVGGGLVGSALAFGLGEQGLRVIVLDESDVAYRAARGNFGLIWVHNKGPGFPAYARWTRKSADLWPAFAETLCGILGMDIGYRASGGLHLCIGEKEAADREGLLAQMYSEAKPGEYSARMLTRAELDTMLPGLGPDVSAGSYSEHDAHVNPLYLLRALHAGFETLGIRYCSGRHVDRVEQDGKDFTVFCGAETFTARKLVLAAGLGTRELAGAVGLDIPVGPLKGQIMITEKAAPFLEFPTTTVRQTEEGGLMLGDSREDVGFELNSNIEMMQPIAERAMRCFPALKDLRIVRSWACLRTMTPDGFPVYHASERCPGAYGATCHSGVTLAAVHARALAPAIANDTVSDIAAPFHPERLNAAAA